MGWREIPGSLYEASKNGDIRRVGSKSSLKSAHHTRGYRSVNISVSGKRKTYLVHRLVCLAYLGPCPNGRMVNHKDGSKDNNKISNLEYVTAKKNYHHAARSGLLEATRGKSLTREQAELIKRLLKGLPRRTGVISILAGLLNVHPSALYQIKYGVTWRNGYNLD